MEGYSDPASLQLVADNFIIDQDVIRDAYRNIYQQAGMDFAQFNYDQIARSRKMQKKDFNDTVRASVWLAKLLDYVDTDCGSLIQETTLRLYAGIQGNTQKAIRMAATNGWGAERTAKEIMRLQGRMDKNRAMTIARTEVMRASNEGAMQGVAEFDIQLKKVWLATTDDRTRTLADGEFDHMEMNGVEVDMNEPFNVNGENIDYPGDPDGSPGNTINCRCAVSFRPKDPII